MVGDGNGDDSELVADFRWVTERGLGVYPQLHKQAVCWQGTAAGPAEAGIVDPEGVLKLWTSNHCLHGPAMASTCELCLMPLHSQPACRRAKRLKKLSRLFTSSAAQSATITFKQRTWILTFIILAAHLVGFTILVTQIESRYA